MIEKRHRALLLISGNKFCWILRQHIWVEISHNIQCLAVIKVCLQYAVRSAARSSLFTALLSILT